MAAITFHLNVEDIASTTDPTIIAHGEGSGLGFFGGSFGLSVPVGQYQESTWVTNANGTDEGIKGNNTKYVSVSGVSHNGGGELDNEKMPNYYAPLNIRFSHDEAVATQNCKLRIFDRSDITKLASGVTTQVYEVRHPNAGPKHDAGSGTLAHRGLSTYDWFEFDPEDVVMTDMAFTSSPGLSGLNTLPSESLPSLSTTYNWLTKEGAAHKSIRHDWYVAVSASPDSIGSKTDYGLYFTLEYL